MPKNRELFHRDPTTRTLANDGVARISAVIDPAVATEELEMFVCEGHYEVGLTTILQTYINNIDKTVQPSGWVSGFFGSGKSHLVKVLRYLWTNEVISDDGKKARDLCHLPETVTDLLRELDTIAKRSGGLFACAGVLESDSAARLPGKIAGIVLAHLGLPSDPVTARFVLRLRIDGLEEDLKAELGKHYEREVEDFRVSSDIAEFLAKRQPSLGADAAAVLDKLNANYPTERTLSIDEMVKLITEAVTQRFGAFPCTLLVLDEAQQYIGNDPDRGSQLQHVAEALSSRFKGRIMVVCTGQSALNTTELLQKLQDRFTRQIQLQDKDIDTVIRNVVLKKEPSMRPAIEQCMSAAEGEISRQLKNTRLETMADDKARYVDDYPVLPVRRRFWERFLRAVETGLTGQLRTQLRLTLEAVQKIADKPLGTVIPADALFDQISTLMVENGVLDRQQSNDIQKLLRSKDADDQLKGRLCGLIFMIHKLPREQNADLGVRATPDALSDLLVDDLVGGGHGLRQKVPVLLAELEKDGILMLVGNEYRQQTAESAQWEQTFQKHLRNVKTSPSEIPSLIADRLRTETQAICAEIKIRQGKAKVTRSLSPQFSEAAPTLDEGVSLWVRTGWETSEKQFTSSIESRGATDPLVAVYIGKNADDEFRDQLAINKAAKLTLSERGAGAQSPAALEARAAIESKMSFSEDRINTLLANAIMPRARVFLAGGADQEGLNLSERINAGVQAALVRLFPQFSIGDSEHWETIFKQAKAGSGKWVGDGNGAGAVAAVTPQNWLFLTGYKKLRERLLKERTWNIVARLGPKGFVTPMWDFNVMLAVISGSRPAKEPPHTMAGVDVMAARTPAEKAALLRGERGASTHAQSAKPDQPTLADPRDTDEPGDADAAQADSANARDGLIKIVPQAEQLKNPDHIVRLDGETTQGELFGEFVQSCAGVCTGDYNQFGRQFWEQVGFDATWQPQQTTTLVSEIDAGLTQALRWEEDRGELRASVEAKLGASQAGSWIRGKDAWSRIGIAVTLMQALPVSLYRGTLFDDNVAVLVPKRPEWLEPAFTFCSSPEFQTAVRKINQKLAVKTQYLIKVPFDLAHWQKIAAEKYPNGLPEPLSDDPTQWLFHGHPVGQSSRDKLQSSNDGSTLQVAVARMVGYRWPAELDTKMRLAPEARAWVEKCKDLKKFADDDGVIPLHATGREGSAADRLSALLAAAFEAAGTRLDMQALIQATGSKAATLPQWLRDDFANQHSVLFHHRPFVWQIWDGKKDGFSVLVHYHRLAAGDGQGRKLLEKIAFTYLGDYITDCGSAMKGGDATAESRRAAAVVLQGKLRAILDGEPPYDLFIRWKPLHQQPIGWEPDINDGVRMNIRPFLKAGVLKGKINVKWDKDRGKEPLSLRPREQFPWFWSFPGNEKVPPEDFEGGEEFDGVRWNDVHYTNEAKRAARES